MNLSGRQRKIRAKRRVAFSVGLLGILVIAAAALGLGTGCIFEEGSYDGGGRRTGAPAKSDPTAEPDGGERDK